MTKEQLREIMGANDIYTQSQAIDAIRFVQNLLEIKIEDAKKNRPHENYDISTMQNVVIILSTLENNFEDVREAL